MNMARARKVLERMRNAPEHVRFAELFNLCVEYFGEPRQRGTSHAVFRMPWSGDPRVNIQDDRGKAKAYQVRQVLAAIDKLESMKSRKRSEPNEED